MNWEMFYSQNLSHDDCNTKIGQLQSLKLPQRWLTTAQFAETSLSTNNSLSDHQISTRRSNQGNCKTFTIIMILWNDLAICKNREKLMMHSLNVIIHVFLFDNKVSDACQRKRLDDAYANTKSTCMFILPCISKCQKTKRDRTLH